MTFRRAAGYLSSNAAKKNMRSPPRACARMLQTASNCRCWDERDWKSWKEKRYRKFTSLLASKYLISWFTFSFPQITQNFHYIHAFMVIKNQFIFLTHKLEIKLSRSKIFLNWIIARTLQGSTDLKYHVKQIFTGKFRFQEFKLFTIVKEVVGRKYYTVQTKCLKHKHVTKKY